jgi:hypothetical protein
VADKEHTCTLKRIFRGVHAAAKKVILLYFAVTGETLRGFAVSGKPGTATMPFRADFFVGGAQAIMT